VKKYSAAWKVTAGLSKHWPFVTDSVVYNHCGINESLKMKCVPCPLTSLETTMTQTLMQVVTVI